MLSQRLGELLGAGVLEAGEGRSYRLSAAGRDLARVLYELNRWAEGAARGREGVILDA